MGGIEILPDETAVNDFKLIELSELFLEYEDDAVVLEKELYKVAKKYLLDENIEDAWKAILSFNN